MMETSAKAQSMEARIEEWEKRCTWCTCEVPEVGAIVWETGQKFCEVACSVEAAEWLHDQEKAIMEETEEMCRGQLEDMEWEETKQSEMVA